MTRKKSLENSHEIQKKERNFSKSQINSREYKLLKYLVFVSKLRYLPKGYFKIMILRLKNW